MVKYAIVMITLVLIRVLKGNVNDKFSRKLSELVTNDL